MLDHFSAYLECLHQISIHNEIQVTLPVFCLLILQPIPSTGKYSIAQGERNVILIGMIENSLFLVLPEYPKIPTMSPQRMRELILSKL